VAPNDRSLHLYQFVRFANSILFACAIALIFDRSMASAFDRIEQVPHWRSDERALVVVDKTGDKTWNEATRHAVNAWTKAVDGTGLRLTWTKGTGGCEIGGSRIEICQKPYQTLGDDIHNDREGLADIRLGDDRTQAHIGGTTIAVCSNCRLEAPRRRVVATHELGHALGLEHTNRIDSVMYPTGGPDRPTSFDTSALKQLYGHADTEDRCALFNLRVGPLCF
jgi:hypothetical protein